jgi:hypothetical protein
MTSSSPPKNVAVLYTDQDFMYKLVTPYYVMPDAAKCAQFETTYLTDEQCNPTGKDFVANSKQCIQQELCKNKHFSDQIGKTQEHHLGSLKMMMDKTQTYDNQVAGLQNIVFGILMMSLAFYKTM